MNYSLLLLPAARKDLDNLEKTTYQRCHKSMLQLGKSPRPSGAKRLLGHDGYRIRVGAWRILYRVDDDEQKVFIYRIKDRKEVYR